VGEIIAVLSGKGGTGKTSVCAGIALALAAEGAEVLCVDCDVGLRNLDISLGLSSLSALSFLDVMGGEYSPEQALAHPLYPKLKFLTAPVNRAADDIDPKQFQAFLDQAREHYRYILLDAPAGVDAGFRLAARFAHRVILVTGADPASIRDAERTGQLLDLMGKQEVRLVVNRIYPKMAAALGLTVDDIMDQTRLPLLGLVPEDPHVMLSAASGKPLLQCTRRGAAAACRRIARRLQGVRTPVNWK